MNLTELSVLSPFRALTHLRIGFLVESGRQPNMEMNAADPAEMDPQKIEPWINCQPPNTRPSSLAKTRIAPNDPKQMSRIVDQ